MTHEEVAVDDREHVFGENRERGSVGDQLVVDAVQSHVEQRELGHANVLITLDIYSHCTANMQQEAAEKIDEALRGALAG